MIEIIPKFGFIDGKIKQVGVVEVDKDYIEPKHWKITNIEGYLNKVNSDLEEVKKWK